MCLRGFGIAWTLRDTPAGSKEKFNLKKPFRNLLNVINTNLKLNSLINFFVLN